MSGSERLIFELSSAEEASTTLLPGAGEPDEQAWNHLAHVIHIDPALSDVASAVLRRHWEMGLAAIAVMGQRIVGHIALLPMLGATLRQRLPQLEAIPEGELSEWRTGFVAPELRGRGVSTFLRTRLAEHVDGGRGLLLSLCVGLGASSTNARMGARLVGYNQIPFLGSLAGWQVSRGCWNLRGALFCSDVNEYRGRHRIPSERDGHDWNQHVHLWVSDEGLALSVESKLRAAMSADLAGFRSTLVATHGRSALLDVWREQTRVFSEGPALAQPRDAGYRVDDATALDGGVQISGR